jgi:hypothetical protein
VVNGDGGTIGDVSLGRFSTIIKPMAIPLSAPISHSAFTYTVAAGETLKDLAKKFNVTVADIRWSNTNLISSDVVATGDQVVIPPVPGIVVTAKATDTLGKLAFKYQSDAQTILDFNRLRTPARSRFPTISSIFLSVQTLVAVILRFPLPALCKASPAQAAQ